VGVDLATCKNRCVGIDKCCDGFWTPKFELPNGALYSDQMQRRYKSAQGADTLGLVFAWNPRVGVLYATQTVRIQGRFSSEMHFGMFPRDKQNLFVVVQQTNAARESTGAAAAEFNPVEFNVSSVSSVRQYTLPVTDASGGGAADMNEWAIDTVQSIPATQRVENVGDVSNHVSQCGFHIKVSRLPDYYNWNVLIPIGVLVAISWFVFLLPPSQLADRLGLVVTLILALLAFQFVINDKLPNTGYLTLLHSFILKSNIMLLVVGIESCVVYVSSHMHLPCLKWFRNKRRPSSSAGGQPSSAGNVDSSSDRHLTAANAEPVSILQIENELNATEKASKDGGGRAHQRNSQNRSVIGFMHDVGGAVSASVLGDLESMHPVDLASCFICPIAFAVFAKEVAG
jgi:hypothetical protein